MTKLIGIILVGLMVLTNSRTAYPQWRQAIDPEAAYISLFMIDRALPGHLSASCFLQSTDYGNTWTIVGGLSGSALCGVNGSKLFAERQYDGIYMSTDDGAKWRRILAVNYPLCFAALGTNFFVGAYYAGLYRSTDGGSTWNTVNNTYAYGVDFAEGEVFAVGEEGVYISTDSGATWNASNVGGFVSAVIVIGKHQFALGAHRVCYSVDNFSTFTEDDSTFASAWIRSECAYDSSLFVGTENGIFLSTDFGTSWTEVDTGLTNKFIWTLAVQGSDLLAGTNGSGLWKRPLSEMTAVKERSEPVPSSFALMQNYPNPFNPATAINYQLGTRTLVVLKVFDVLGREIETLVDGRQSEGSHSVEFNAASLPSGVYFYSLEAGTYHDTKKLLLLK